MKVDFSKYVPEGFGTADCIIVADGILEVIDFKYGKGVVVEATGNSQMMLYALGALEFYRGLYDIETVRMSIFQPRVANSLSEYEVEAETLTLWGERTVLPRAKLAFNGGGEFNPSEDVCRWCKVRDRCKARYEANLTVFDETPCTDTITVEQAAEVLKRAGDIKKWLKDLETMVSKSLIKGDAVEGYKLVAGRGKREYLSEKVVGERLKEFGLPEHMIYEKKLRPLTAFEAEYGKIPFNIMLGDLIQRTPGAPILAPDSDRRKAITPDELTLNAFDEA
jgi:hypothetical protein